MQRSIGNLKPVLLFAFLLVQFVSRAQDPDSTADARAGADTVRISAGGQLKTFVLVTGTITNAVTGLPLAGINVRYKDFSAAITDSAGNFSLKVPDYQVAIQVESEGYQSKEIALKGRPSVSSGLYDESFGSYYDMVTLPLTQKPLNQVPYAISQVQTQGAWNRAFETPDGYLQGKVAGLNAIRRSGTPNIGANLFLRGFTSLYATNQPLIIVDGVIFDNTDYGSSLISSHYTSPLAYIDVRDIDNISVIKDGSSVYGTKGANGVIMITTARAKELATRIDFAAYGGINFLPSSIPLLNASDYRVYLAQVLQSGGLSNAQIQSFPYMNDNVNNPEYYRYHYNTNWQKNVLNNSPAQNYYLKVTGGDNIARYALTIGFMKNQGVVKGTDLTRYNTRFNADLNLSKRLTASTNLSFTFNEQNIKDQGLANKTNPLYLALIKSPFLHVNQVSDAGIESPDLADTDIFNVSNPVAIINNMQGENKNYRFSGSIGFNYHLSKPWSLGTTVSMTIDKVRERMFIPGKGVVTDTLFNAIAVNRSGSQVKRLFMLYNDTRLSYNKTFGNVHTLGASLGFRYLQNKTEEDFGLGFNSATDELVSVGNGVSTLRKVGGNIGENRWMSTYLNADYNISDKYFLSFNMAADGSSRFGTEIKDGALQVNGNSYALLPSIAGAWIVSAENFMSGSAIELLKLRASFGLSGNDDIGNYAAKQYYVSQNLLGIQGLARGNFGNPQLQWEKQQKLNAGIDLAFFNERLTITLDAYHNETSKMLIYQPAAAASGLVFAVNNEGGMKTRGVEASIHTRLVNHATLKWDLGLTAAHHQSRITRLPVDNIITSFGGADIITAVNSDPNLFYGYKTAGIYNTNEEAVQQGYSIRAGGTLRPLQGGDVRFADINADKIIDDKDRVAIGNPNPDVVGSVSSRTEWKRWSLEALFTFSQGNEIYNYVRNQLESVSGFNNQTTAVKNSWRNNGDQATMPRASWGDPSGNSRFSDRWIEDGSYFRLRTVSVSYDIASRAKFLKYAVVYLTANNVFTLTRYLGYDPELSATESVLGQGIDLALEPQHRSVQAGVRIGL